MHTLKTTTVTVAWPGSNGEPRACVSTLAVVKPLILSSYAQGTGLKLLGTGLPLL